MNIEHVTLNLPVALYKKLQTLAEAEHTDPVRVIEKLVGEADHHQNWLKDLRSLRQQIQEDRNFVPDMTKEDLIAQLHQTRQEIFETEYAHLYR